MQERHAFWAPWDTPGFEHLRLGPDPDGVAADAWLVRLLPGGPLRLRYRVHCDPAWRCRALRVEIEGGGAPPVDLRGDGRGRWTTAAGQPLPALDGCLDVDLNATPFTNTLPIRRLDLAPGRTAELGVVYVRAPELSVARDAQRYTRLDRRRWRYEAVDRTFTVELAVDEDGLVLDYPGAWRRLWPRPA